MNLHICSFSLLSCLSLGRHSGHQQVPAWAMIRRMAPAPGANHDGHKVYNFNLSKALGSTIPKVTSFWIHMAGLWHCFTNVENGQRWFAIFQYSMSMVMVSFWILFCSPQEDPNRTHRWSLAFNTGSFSCLKMRDFLGLSKHAENKGSMTFQDTWKSS